MSHVSPSRLRRTLTAVALASGGALASAVVAGATTGFEALIADSGDAFLRTSYVEVGARPNGTFGSDVAPPAGWHPNDTPKFGEPANPGIGFRADRDLDGWGVGTDDGDFFIPYAPYEGFSLQVGSNLYRNNDGRTEIPGTFSTETTTPLPSVTWTSSSDTDGIGLTQVYTIPSPTSLAIKMTVTLTNNGSASADVLYMRVVDPDPCANRAEPVCDTDDDGVGDESFSAETRQTIIGHVADGDPASRVTAEQTDGSWIALTSTASDSVVWAGEGDRFVSLAEIFDAPRTYTAASPLESEDDDDDSLFNKTGESRLEDRRMGLLVKRTIPAGESVSFEMRYLLNENQPADGVPTLPDTGAEPAGLMLGAMMLVVFGTTVSILFGRRIRSLT